MDTVIIQIPQDDVGRIIGKQGAQIKALRERSGCEIVVDTTTQSCPVARLKGTSSAIAAAKSLISNICGGDGVVFIRDMDDVSIGHLARNNFLQSQQKEADVVVDIRGRNLKITAKEPSVARQFKQKIEEHIVSQSEWTTQSILCDAVRFKKVREDPGIQQLETTQNLKMEVTKDNSSGTHLCLKGQRGAVEEAMEIIQVLLSSEGESSRDFVQITPDLFAGCPAKKQDDFASDLEEGIAQKYNVVITFARNSTKIQLEGAEANVSEAKAMVEELLQYYFNTNCVSLRIPVVAIPDICGNHNQQLVRLQAIDLCVSLDKADGRIWICGNTRKAEMAFERFSKAVAEWNNTNVIIPLRHERYVGILTGPRGETIRKMQEATTAHISIEKNVTGDDSVAFVWIRGPTADVVKAAQAEVELNLKQASNSSRQNPPHFKENLWNENRPPSRRRPE